MLDLVPAHPSMAARLTLQPAQARGGEMPQDVLERMCAAGHAFALVDERAHKVFLMGGFLEVWPGRAALWSLIDKDAGPHMLSIVRTAQRSIGFFEHRFKRIEAYVACDHAEGHRLIHLLGFSREGLMRAFWNEQDYHLYARVR